MPPESRPARRPRTSHRSHQLEHLADAAPAPRHEHPEQARDEVDVLVRRQVGVQGELLGHVADALAGRPPEPPRVLAQHPDLARGGVEGARDQADRGRLAGARRPDDAQDRARRDLQVEVEHADAVAEVAARAAETSIGGRGGAGRGMRAGARACGTSRTGRGRTPARRGGRATGHPRRAGPLADERRVRPSGPLTLQRRRERRPACRRGARRRRAARLTARPLHDPRGKLAPCPPIRSPAARPPARPASAGAPTRSPGSRAGAPAAGSATATRTAARSATRETPRPDPGARRSRPRGPTSGSAPTRAATSRRPAATPAGRKQHRYHPAYRARREQAKYDGMLAVRARCCRAIRERVDADLGRPGLPREKVLAAVVRLLELTLIRVGNDEYAKLNRSFGLTTLRDRHAKVRGEHDPLPVPRQERGPARRHAPRPAAGARRRRGARTCPARTSCSTSTRRARSATSGPRTSTTTCARSAAADVTAKDFRTWAGTVLAYRALLALQPGDTDREARRNVVEAVRQTAESLGNTPAVARRSYVHPAVLERVPRRGDRRRARRRRRGAGGAAAGHVARGGGRRHHVLRERLDLDAARGAHRRLERRPGRPRPARGGRGHERPRRRHRRRARRRPRAAAGRARRAPRC